MGTSQAIAPVETPTFRRYFHLRAIPFWFIHAACLGAFFVDFSWTYVALAAVLYVVRMFLVTGVYHRYFSHRAYNTSRTFQFILAFFAQTTAQKGCLWWAAHHRHHHAHSDQPEDIHSPKDGFWYSHMGWILDTKNDATEDHYIRDLNRYPELQWLNRHHLIPFLLLGAGLYLWLGLEGVVWGWCISTVLVWHGTFTINSLSHVWGGQRYKTTDTSRNNPVLAIVTLGEGWHNNHHRFQSSARNGFFWWEYDITYYILKLMSFVGLVWNLRPVPKHLLDETNESWLKNQVQSTKELLEQARTNFKHSVKESATRLAETAKIQADEVKEQWAMSTQQISDSVQQMSESAQQFSESAMLSARQSAGEFKQNAEELALSLRTKIDETSMQLSESAEDLKQSAGMMAEDFKHSAETMADELASKVQEHIEATVPAIVRQSA